MFGFGFKFREVDEVRETRIVNKAFNDKINKQVEDVKNKMTNEEWEKILQDLDKPLFKR